MGEYERQFIDEAFESNYIAPLGPQVNAFEREFSERMGLPYAVALCSCTAALHLSLVLLGVKPGDVVLASSLTFIGGVVPIRYVGAEAVFLDSNAQTWNMDLDFLEEELLISSRRNRLPKAVLATELYGQCLDLDRLLAICRPHHVPVVVDAAESVGSLYKGKSSHRDVQSVAYSFNGNKIITTSGGGMLCSGNRELVEGARYLSQQARDPGPHYEHSQIGYNYRLSNVLAAIGRGQLRVLVERVAAKRRIFKCYFDRLSGIPGVEFMPEDEKCISNRWLSVVLITPEEFGADRETVRRKLEAENIESRPVWKPMHMQPIFIGNKCIGGGVAEDFFKRGLCLPSGTAMSDADIDRVVSAILKCRL